MAQLKYNPPASFLVNQATGEQYPLDSEIMVGSKSGFKGEGVSAQHCLIRSNGYQFFIIDLKSQTGTLINGHPIPSDEWTPLNHGQQLTLGSLNIIFSDSMYAFASDAIVISEAGRLKAVPPPSGEGDSEPSYASNFALHFFDGFFFMFAAYLSFLTALNFLAFPVSRASFLVQLVRGDKH